MRLPFLPIHIYGHRTVVAPILQPRSTVHIQKLKYPVVKSLKKYALKYRPSFPFLLATKLLFAVNWLSYNLLTAKYRGQSIEAQTRNEKTDV